MKRTITLLIVLIFLSGLKVRAQETTSLNSNYLIANGVSPKVLDAAASTLLQEGSFTENIELEIVAGANTTVYNMVMLYDPAYKYGKDIRFVINAADFSPKEKKQFIKAIEKSHTYSRLSRSYLYDESTLKLVSNDGTEAVYEYYYQTKEIEPSLKDIKKLKGTIYFNNDVLDRVVLTDFKKLSRKRTDYEKVVKFSKTVPEGSYVVSAVTERFTQNTSKGPVTQTLKYATAEYKAPNGNNVSWQGKGQVAPVFGPGVTKDTLNVSLGGLFPLLGKPATKLGFGLPRPFGVSAIRHVQNTNLQFTDLQLGTNGEGTISLKDLFSLDESSLDETVNSWLARVDLWTLPFLNVYGLIGRANANIDGSIVLDSEFRGTLIGLAPFLGLDPNNIPNAIPLLIDVDVNTIGYGATLGGAIGNFVATVNYQFLVADTPEAGATVSTHVLMPLVGYRVPVGLSVFVGAQGQYYDSNIAGSIAMDDNNTLDYSVNFEPRRWNAIVGANQSIGKHWDLTFNLGFGARKSTTVVLGYRF